MNKRKYFGSVNTKVYVGEKSVNIHFSPKEKNNALKFARLIIQAVENGRSIDLAAYHAKPSKTGAKQITITSI